MKCLHIVSREVARDLGLRSYFTATPCKHGHLSERHTVDTKCFDCKREKDKRYYSRNKEKIVDKVRVWSKDNPDKRREYLESWKNKDLERFSVITRNSQHRRRARQRGTEVEFSPAVTEWVLRQDKICRYCGCSCPEDYEIDHFYPIVDGGKHEIENLVISCRTCNRAKHTKDPFTFLREIRNDQR